MANIIPEKRVATIQTGKFSKVSDLQDLVDVVFHEITKDVEAEQSFLQRNIDSDKSFPMYQPEVYHDYSKSIRKEVHNDVRRNNVASQQFGDSARARTPKTDQENSTNIGLSKSNFLGTVLTPEIEADLEILRNRHALDPKRHYKRTHRNLPKLFQMARIVKTPKGVFASRSRKNERVFVDDLLVDKRFKKFCTKKFLEIQRSKERRKKKFVAKK